MGILTDRNRLIHNRILEELSKEFDLEVQLIEKKLDYFFKTMYAFMKTPTMPVVRLRYFGTFKPNFYRIKNRLKKYIAREEDPKRIEQLTKVRDRLVTETVARTARRNANKAARKLNP